MKQVKVVFGKGGKARILAHGTFGEGTAQFTLDLADKLGEITERHQGHHHTHESVDVDQKVQVKVSR